jgi:hypothetical protein
MESTRSVDKNGTIRYENENGKFHRTDGPAIEIPNGIKAWIVNGEYHREDGPARVGPNGIVDYYLNGKKYTKEDWEREVLKIRLGRIKDL